jgi:hypothetical protein
VVALYLHFARRGELRVRWRSVIVIGVAIGLGRAVLAGAGWYAVEHSGGPLQIPGFAFTMLAWPEAAVFARHLLTLVGHHHRAPAPPTFFLALGVLLTATSLIAVSALALIAHVSGRVPRRAGRS